MVSVNELLDQSGAKIEQIISAVNQKKYELGPEHLATRLREILETFQEMQESLQPVLLHFNGLDLERIHKLCICSQELLNSQGSEQERGVSSRNRLETDNYEYQGVLLPSQVKHMETIWEWLNNDRVGTIGIEGEVGMGKTWMVRQLKDRAIAANLFDVVIWMDPIWMDPNQKSFLEAQQELVDQLGFFITKEPDEEYYGRKDIMLKVALALGKKRYLLILNNLRHEDTIVEDFGFSKPGEQNVYSKVLVSGPKMYIDLIKTDRKFQVEPLNEDEAWLLFLGITGLDIDSPHVVEIAKPLVASCKGVLSEIVTREDGRDIAELTNKVCHLLNSDKMEVIECLRFCSYLSGVGRIKVKDFIAWWILEVFDDCLGLEEAYEKAHHVLQELIDGRFLERNETHVWVKNKLVFHVELDHFFTSGTLPPEYKNKRSCVMNEKFKSKDSGDAREREETTELLLIYGKHMKRYNLLRYIPADFFAQKMQKLHTLAILNAGIVFLPESLPNLKHLEMLIIRGCGSLKNLDPIRELWNLKLLLLPGASSLKEIPDDIFKNMDKLAELDLSNSKLEQLPSSFSNLCNIQILILRGCSRLTSIPDMPYQKLIELDLSGTLVQSLPSPSNLANIRNLFLRGCTEITTMPHPNKYKNLFVIDLSGATSFREFQGKNIPFGYRYFLSKVNLSGTLIAQVPPFVEFYNVSKLLLRNCCYLETMPALDFSVEVLDLSGSIAFKYFHDAPLSNQLRNLDLSKTQIEKLPMLSMNSAMVQLILRECGLLEELPHLELQKLQVLDLSGSTKFKTFKDDSFDKLRKLKILNLSETQVANLPTLSQCSELQHLILRKCLKLEELPHLVTLEKLELLDLSSAISFKQFKEESLGKKEALHELNLFETQVVQIPSLSECHNLHKLILGGCSKLEILPNLEALSRLIVLDLSGISLIKFHYQSTGLKYDCLQVLDLSGTQVSDLSFITGCKDLRQLSLRDCPNILTLPPLDELTRLEELDLSRTETTELSFLSGCRSIIQLLLNDCSNILELTSLKEHTRLEVLDIAGTKIYDLSVLTGFNKLSQLSLRGCPNLKTLSFEGMQNLLKLNLSHSSIKLLPSSFSGIRNLQSLLLTDCSSLGTLPRMEFLPKLEVLDLSCTNVREFPNDISALTHLRFLKLQEENSEWEFHKGKSYEKFHFCLFAPKERIGENDIYLQGQQYSFKDIYYQTSHIPSLAEEPDKFFKICGFQTFPAGIEEVLLHVVLLYLKKNNFLTRLSDLGAENVREMRECWIENSDSMEFVFYGEEVNENGALGRCLENLWVSKLPELKSLFRGVVQPGSFTLLKHLYIECCPSLVTVFSSHLELKNLEVLKMKFCDKIEGIFGETVIGEKTLPKLKTLILLKLPELQSICGGVLPSLQNLRVIGCSKIKRLPLSRKATSPVKIKGEAVWWNDLEWEDEGTKSHQRFSPY